MAKNTQKRKTNIVNKVKGDFEYKMPKAMADAYLKARKGEDKKKQPDEYLREIVDIDFRIKGKCSRVIVE